MKYIEVRQFGGPDRLELLESDTLPEPAAGEVLIKVKAAGINYADIMARAGNYPPIAATPYRPGIEVAGVVMSSGAEVKGFALGDRVLALCFNGGGYSTHVSVPAAHVFKLPDAITFDAAAALLVQGMAAYFLLEESKLTRGETVLINAAAGGVGSVAVQLAARAGATVVGLASESKHAHVKANGASAVLAYGAPGWSDSVLKVTNGRGVDVFIDAQGDLSDPDAFKALAQKGRWLVHGWLDDARNGFPNASIIPLIFKNVTIRGYSVHSSVEHYQRALTDLFAWVIDGSLELTLTTYALADAGKAHAAIAGRLTTGKVILTP